MAVSEHRMSCANTRAYRSQRKNNNAALQEVKVSGRVYNIPRRIAKVVQLGLVDVEKP